MNNNLIEYVPGSIWTCAYSVYFCGTHLNARMTIVRLSDGSLMLHSPGNISPELKEAICALGKVRHIVAPGTFHFLHVDTAQKHFPEAKTYICPGLESKQSNLKFDWILADCPPAAWEDDMAQVLVRGSRFMVEVAFFHQSSKTLILVDLIENYGDSTKEKASRAIKFYWKFVFRMWNKPKPAPEYQLGWKNKKAAKEALERMLEWDFERIILSHGDCIESDAKAVAKKAWSTPLNSEA